MGVTYISVHRIWLTIIVLIILKVDSASFLVDINLPRAVVATERQVGTECVASQSAILVGVLNDGRGAGEGHEKEGDGCGLHFEGECGFCC